jgi:2-oxoglutarate/2-oxoacid ferredoxin oxidoreductase subunit alpha
MKMDTTPNTDIGPTQNPIPAAAAFEKTAEVLREHIIEVVSDSGEGAQKCGQTFAAIAARMGNGIWTVEIIPAEIQPPARSIEGASGNRIRVGAGPITNGGDETDLVVAFNEQALIGRVKAGELKPGCIILLENKWAHDRDPDIVEAYTETRADLIDQGFDVRDIPMEDECLKHVRDAKKGKNMFVLGMLCSLYSMDMQMAREQVAFIFRKKSETVIEANYTLLEAGHAWAESNVDLKYTIPAEKSEKAQIVVNGNISLALGVMASGMQVCAMYPITPATSASHYLSEVFQKVGGVVHQAEDEIAACTFAIGASFAGKCALTITSGPGYSLKQEAIGLAVMGEIPLVVINVQRGGPSTGQPTKGEQSDLLTAVFGSHGDAPKVVMAVSSIEDCFYSMITARRIAEAFHMVVVVLTDANLATAQQPFIRPEFAEGWVAEAVDQNSLPDGSEPYDWDGRTGLARRQVPGQPHGMHCLTGLAHDRNSRVAYDPEINQQGMMHRSLKLATFQKTLKTPPVVGGDEGDLLIIGWGSSKGAIEEAVERCRADGLKVSSVHLKFIQPLPSGLKEIFDRFGKVMTIENNWNDSMEHELIDADNRRFSNLAWLIRGRYLVDIDCWGEVKGQPLKPGSICRVVREKLGIEGA